MEFLNTLLSGYILPVLLTVAGIFLGAKLRFFYILHPVSLIKELKSSKSTKGVSPFKALTQALAGTLGVGNMTGVATAICAGGAGAVFWMWISAFFAMSIKYFEVALAVKWRRQDSSGYYGGAMYYIREIFQKRFPRVAIGLGSLFAVLCIANSLLSGNIVQINSAAAVFEFIPPYAVGIACAACALPLCLGKGKKVSDVTMGLIPFLSGVYIILSLIIIIPSATRLPGVFSEIFCGAFSMRAAGGGIGGFLFMKAIRFGTARGIFSNEAGSGTSPTAHAEADTKSPHSQGCFGIFEVFADTIVLCTLTAVVILLSDGCARGYDGIKLTLYAFASQAGAPSALAVGICIILFAYATIICQTHYGLVALQSITATKASFYIYVCLSFLATIAGSVINDDAMWQAQDLVVALMTSLNTVCLIYAAFNGHLNSIFPKKAKKSSAHL